MTVDELCNNNQKPNIDLKNNRLRLGWTRLSRTCSKGKRDCKHPVALVQQSITGINS